jgi:hypothetical protein
LAIGAVLRIGAPVIDRNLSARPLAAEIRNLENGSLPLAVYEVSRQTEYGLQFYSNQNISRYELGQIPAAEHIVVATHASQTEVAKLVAGRRVSYLGTYAPQELDYYWVAREDGQRR